MLIGISGYISSGKDTVAKMIQFLAYQKVSPVFKTFDEWLTVKNPEGNVTNADWKIKKYAGKLKQMVSLFTGIPVDDLERASVKESELGQEWDCLLPTKHGAVPVPMTVRSLLQKLGTEAVRNHVHPNAWVNALFADYKPKVSASIVEVDFSSDAPLKQLTEPIYGEYPNWVISDARFPNEAQAIKDRGGIVVRINRPVLTEEGRKRQEPGVLAIAASIERSRHPSETSLDDWEFDYVIDNSGSLEDLLEQVRTMLLHFKIIE